MLEKIFHPVVSILRGFNSNGTLFHGLSLQNVIGYLFIIFSFNSDIERGVDQQVQKILGNTHLFI